MAKTSDVRKRLSVERYAGGLAQRASEDRLEKAVGHFLLSKRAVSELTDPLPQDYEACRTRELSGDEVASLFMEAVDDPLRRWGSKRGGGCVWAICGEGRQGLLPLSTANREREERWLEVVRDLVTRGLQTPGTITTDGAAGVTQAMDAIWPKALRIRGGLHKMQNLHQKIPPQAWPECKQVGVDRRDAPAVAEAERRRQWSVNRSQRDFPAACRCLLDAAAARLTPLYGPPRPHPSGRTSPRAERAFAEERRRTTVLPPLWEEGSVVKRVFAVLIRLRERWGKTCCSAFEHHQIRSLRARLKVDDHDGRWPVSPADSPPRRSAASAA